MDVAIIGAGSIGLLLGTYFAEAGLSVTMLVRREEQCEDLNKKGISRLQEDGRTVIFPVYATTAYQDIASAKLIIVAVKYKDLVPVLTHLKEEAIQAPLLFIQNGLGHLRHVMEEDFPISAFATVEHGALRKSNHLVKHNGVGALTIGVAFGDVDDFQLINEADCQRFPVHWHADASYILLRKALINCLINPLTTILNVPNGSLVTCSHSHQLMQRLYEELVAVFPEVAIDLPFEVVENVCESTARNDSSMLTDYRQGRPMEIETIVSAVIQEAAVRGESLPLLQTYEQLLYVLDGKAN